MKTKLLEKDTNKCNKVGVLVTAPSAHDSNAAAETGIDGAHSVEHIAYTLH